MPGSTPASPFPGLQIFSTGLTGSHLHQRASNCSDAGLAQLLSPSPTRSRKLPSPAGPLPSSLASPKEFGKSGRARGLQTDHTHPAPLCHRFACSRLPATAAAKLSSDRLQLPGRQEGESEAHQARSSFPAASGKGTFRAKLRGNVASPGSLPRCPHLPLPLSWPRLWQRCKPWVTLLICWQMLSITLRTK